MCWITCSTRWARPDRGQQTEWPGAVSIGPRVAGAGRPQAFTRERLDLANTTLSTQARSITLAGSRELFTTRPILVHPGKPTGRTIMSMIAETPAAGSPVLHVTPDAPSHYDPSHWHCCVVRLGCALSG
jgi:hypothetical protein